MMLFVYFLCASKQDGKLFHFLYFLTDSVKCTPLYHPEAFVSSRALWRQTQGNLQEEASAASHWQAV